MDPNRIRKVIDLIAFFSGPCKRVGVDFPMMQFLCLTLSAAAPAFDGQEPTRSYAERKALPDALRHHANWRLGPRLRGLSHQRFAPPTVCNWLKLP
jgi:hypothetical protein